MADGAATVLAGFGGGSGTTTYAENIGVMAATKVYSTAAYWVAGIFAIILSFSPKFGELIATVPAGVLGGAATMLYGMIGILGVKIWVQNKVNFSNPVNLTTAAVALIIGIADYTWTSANSRSPGSPWIRRRTDDLPRHEGDCEGTGKRRRTGNRTGRTAAGCQGRDERRCQADTEKAPVGTVTETVPARGLPGALRHGHAAG